MLHQEQYMRHFKPEMVQFLDDLPYDICRQTLYTTEELFAGCDPQNPETLTQSFDARVFRHYLDTGLDTASPEENWARQCHDTAISIAFNKKLSTLKQRQIVGIMGGHAMSRSDDAYRKIVQIAQKLTETGWLVLSGGGSGAMEAVHLGAWLAGRTEADVDEAMKILKCADFFSDPAWVPSAYEVRQRFPRLANAESIAIPTWVFAREPPNMFATHAAKFFSNSIREDTLITASFGGIMFLPGSAGTFREIFQDIVQNHYLTWEYPSPMIFVGREYWSKTVPLYPAIQDMLKTRQFKNLLAFLVDDVDQIVDVVHDFQNLYPLIRAKQQGKSHILEQLFSRKKNASRKR